MTERKSQRGLRQRDFETLAYLLDSAHPVLYLIRGRSIVVASLALHAGREYAGIEWSADHHGDLLFLAERQETRQRLLFEKGVAAREKERVEVGGARQFLGDLPFIDSGPNGLDRARRPQLVQGAIASFHKLPDPRVGGFPASVGEDIDIVAVNDIHVVETEALEREFERAHHTVVGIVEALPPRRGFKEHALTCTFRRLTQIEQPADLGGNQIGAARLRTQETVQSGLGKSQPVKRRGVKVATASRPDGVQHRARFLFHHRSIEIAERHSPETELGELQLDSGARRELSDPRAPPIRGRRHQFSPPWQARKYMPPLRAYGARLVPALICPPHDQCFVGERNRAVRRCCLPDEGINL